MKARKKPIVVDVEGPITQPTFVATTQGTVLANPGDYILTDPNTGDQWPVNGNVFERTYDVLEEEGN
jgi:hypothetical protein